jgi:hypothetical protein
MLRILDNIPNINTYPLTYVFEIMKLEHTHIRESPDKIEIMEGVILDFSTSLSTSAFFKTFPP